MRVQKVSGVADGYILTINGQSFAVMQNYDADSQLAGVRDTTNLDWNSCAYEYVPYGIYNPDKTWTISENPKPKNGGFRCQLIGRLVTNLEQNAKARMPREEFMKLVTPLFKEALTAEAQYFECPY